MPDGDQVFRLLFNKVYHDDDLRICGICNQSLWKNDGYCFNDKPILYLVCNHYFHEDCVINSNISECFSCCHPIFVRTTVEHISQTDRFWLDLIDRGLDELGGKEVHPAGVDIYTVRDKVHAMIPETINSAASSLISCASVEEVLCNALKWGGKEPLYDGQMTRGKWTIYGTLTDPPENRVWKYSWGVPPTTRCSVPSCASTANLKACSNCAESDAVCWYCCRACQVAHWKLGHREQCQRFQAAKESLLQLCVPVLLPHAPADGDDTVVMMTRDTEGAGI